MNWSPFARWKYAHYAKLAIAAATAATGAVFAIIDPTGQLGVQATVSGVLVFIGGLFGVAEITAHVKSVQPPQ